MIFEKLKVSLRPCIGFLLVIGTALGAPSIHATPTGTISSNSPCTLTVDESVTPNNNATTCTVNVSWSATNSPITCVWALNPTQLWACTNSGNQAWQWANATPRTMELVNHATYPSGSQADLDSGTVLASTSITAHQAALSDLTLSTETYTDYAPYFSKVAGQIDNIDSSLLPSSQFTVVPDAQNPTTLSEVMWSSPTGVNSNPISVLTASHTNYDGEIFQSKTNCTNGWPFIWQNAYTNHIYQTNNTYVTYTYSFHSTKVLISFDGSTFDISSQLGSCGGSGIPYAIATVPTVAYSLQVWASMDVGTEQFFWAEQFSPVATVSATSANGGCWSGAAPTSRQSIAQDEVWWDNQGGWSIGSGDLVNGSPDGKGLTYADVTTIGKGAGWIWTGAQDPTNSGWFPCLSTTWTWN